MANASLRQRLGDIIFEADKPLARLFDVVLLWAILLSILLVMLESVASIRADYGPLLRRLEWFFTGLFTVEYVLRVYSARKRWRYVRSFFGIVDLVAVIPGYISLFFVGTQYLLVIRSLRLLRVFRVLKLARYVGEADVLMTALRASRAKITVFLIGVSIVIVLVGSTMYIIEGSKNGFTDIPTSLYWAVVTLTTVGYGDISPQTPLGKTIAGMVMILGYAIIAVPTGIVTSEVSQALRRGERPLRCPECGHTGHDEDAAYCKRCGAELDEAEQA